MVLERRARAVVVGLLAVAVGGGAAILFARGPATCPAIGYGNLAAIELEVPEGTDAVAACLGPGCTPRPVPTAADGTWSVPQEDPYLQSPDAAGSVTHVTVQAQARGTVVVDGVLEVERQAVNRWARCPGPFRYLPVQVG
ncbi:hypothetical protein [Actinotalea sp. K2]|uniref:hypothetical protein n=1 Tax=Actinotalea sp. K2 TaxID=2939438 RepID=UPI0020179F14|nr:hypothetical protein [Actinotalea sp. K2]MCL3859661.1 hypothetical protein [Actinotalea sp. K2]